MALDFFYPNVCHVCKTFFTDKQALKKCSQCKLVAYCSTEHQKEHWPEHQLLCRAVRKVLKQTKEKSIFDVAPPGKGWDSVRTTAMLVTESMMGRPLLVPERQMFWFPLACQVCHSLEPKQLFDCEFCRCVLYCSQEHKDSDKEAHSKLCRDVKLCFELDRLMFDSFTYPEIKVPLMIEYRELPDDIEQFIAMYVEPSQDVRYFKFVASETLTCAATLLYAIEQASGKLLSLDGRLRIHVVGAAILENSLIHSLEVVLHWFDDITSLSVTFIGPDSVHVHNGGLILCESCTTRKKIRLSYSQLLYHEFISTAGYFKPDIILAFNCGFCETYRSDNDPWNDSLPYFVFNSQILTVMTSYTKSEADLDLQRVLDCVHTNVSTHVLTKCLRNPFRSLRPYRDWENGKLYYQNNFVTIIETMDEIEDHQAHIDVE